MNVTITPRPLSGMIVPPPSKSQAHRLVIAAALSGGTCAIENIAFSQDILATLGCMEQLGATWEKLNDHTIALTGVTGKGGDTLPRFDCGESGSTLRFLIPIALALRGGGVFTGRGRLMSRPQQPYFELFHRLGIAYDLTDGVLTVRGSLPAGDYALPGDVSSQFFTGLLYALPLCSGTSTLRPTTKLESRSYVDMTADALQQAGVSVLAEGEGFVIPGNQQFAMKNCAVEADWSQSGFYYAAKGVGNELGIFGMNPHSKQGDRVIAEFYNTLCQPGEAVLDVSDCPDLVPPLAAHAALRGGGSVTRIVNAARLRMKESDRLTAVTGVLTALGADMTELPDGLIIRGRDRLLGGATVDSFNDHRIAMMAAVAATGCDAPVTIKGADCIKKSYPNFWEDYVSLGGVLSYD